MGSIKGKYIVLALACLIVFSVCLVLGFLRGIFFVPAVLALALYIIVDRKYLRCPGCGGFTNIDRLLHARSHPDHCSRCGRVIDVEK